MHGCICKAAIFFVNAQEYIRTRILNKRCVVVFNKRGPVTLTAKTKMFAAYFALFLVIFWGNIGQGQANEAKQPKDEINGMVALSVYFVCSD